MKRQVKLWTGRTFVLVAVVFAAQYWGMPLYKQYLTPKKVETFVPTTRVKSGKFVISFHEIGTLDAVNSVSVPAEVSGKIISIAAEGSFVKAGQKLVELDTTDAQREARTQVLNYQNALADVDRAKAEMAILKKSDQTEVDQQQAEFDFNKTEFDRAKAQLARMQRLQKQKLISGDQGDQADIDVRSKQLAVTKGQMALELKKKEVESKEQQKDADVRNKVFAANMSKSNLDEVQGRLKKAVILAPASGMVVIKSNYFGGGEFRKFKVGDSVGMRQIICNLPDLSSMQVNVKVGEADAPRLRTGLPVLIKLDAVPNKTFHGTIKEIASLATESNPWEGETPGLKTFDVTVAVREADPKTLKPGMSADVEFICDSVNKSLYVPMESVVEQDSKTYVYVKKGKHYERVAVKTGKHNDNFICITKGLRAGQIVALHDPTKPSDQQESGTKGADQKDKKKDKKKSAPIPGAAKS